MTNGVKAAVQLQYYPHQNENENENPTWLTVQRLCSLLMCLLLTRQRQIGEDENVTFYKFVISLIKYTLLIQCLFFFSLQVCTKTKLSHNFRNKFEFSVRIKGFIKRHKCLCSMRKLEKIPLDCEIGISFSFCFCSPVMLLLISPASCFLEIIFLCWTIPSDRGEVSAGVWYVVLCQPFRSDPTIFWRKTQIV